MKNLKLNLTAIILSAIVIWLNFKYIPNNILSWDVFGYYLYLPSFFIYHDLGLHDLSALNAANEVYGMTPYYYQFVGTATGGHMNIYQGGMALLYLPFFLIGHLAAYLFNFPIDGFSAPYQYSVWGGGMVYSVIGIFGLTRLLRKFFTTGISILTTVLIVLGTNYLLHATLHASNLMTANILFTTYVLFLLATVRWFENQTLKNIIPLGLLAGLMMYARPIEMLALLIPFLWNVKNYNDFKERLVLIFNQRKQFIVLFAIIFIFIILQLAYSRIASGSFFKSPYRTEGEDGLYLQAPHIFKTLFSFRKGWLIYTPLMLLSFAGIMMYWRRKNSLFLPILVFSIIYIYFVSSWSIWWYAAGFSQRALIQILPVMSLPLGFFLTQLNSKSLIFKGLIGLLLVFIVGLNLLQSWQYSMNILSDSRMTRAAYFKIFGKTTHVADIEKYLIFNRGSVDETQPIDTAFFKHVKTIDNQFETTENKNHMAKSGEGSLRINAYEKSFHLKTFARDLYQKDLAYLRLGFWIFVEDSLQSDDLIVVIFQKHFKKQQKTRIYRIHDFKPIPNQWNYISVNYITPELKRERDRFEAFLQNNTDKIFYVDDLKLEVFELREDQEF